MKKIAILTSILALAACGGGSGGGGSAPIMPDAPVTPDEPSLAWETVDADFGLGMVDINATRSANVDKAIKIAQLIEDENAGFEHDASIARNASARKMKSADLNITQEDIDKAYATMYDIFVNHNYKDYTNHDVLVSLALIYMDKAKILELLGNGNNGLDEKIAELIGGLKDNDDFFKDAQDIYQGFGKEFDLTLKDAHFYHNSNDDEYYTFVFDDDDKLVALQEKDGYTYDKDKNGSFIKRVNGYEYTFDFQSDENNSRYFSGTVDKFYEEEPSVEDLKKDIMAEIMETHNNCDEETFAEIQEILDNATLKTGDEEIENHIVGRRADYADIVRIETGSKELGLRYSDFGLIYNIIKLYEQDGLLADTDLKTFEYTEHNGLIGGYEDKKAFPTQNTTYTGAAYAGLTRKTADKDMEDDLVLEQLEPRNEYYKGTAKLTIDDNMEQKLVADFSDAGWYEVTVAVADLKSDSKFTFDAKGNEIHEDWQPHPDTHDGKMENQNIKFYGPTPDNATEAVGLIQYIEDKVSDGDWTFKADITFGGKRD